MTQPRVVTRIFCSRSKGAHQLGMITTDAEGLLLSYQTSVHTSPTDPTAVISPQDACYYRASGAKVEERPPVGEVRQVDIWCQGCKTGHPVDSGALFKAAQEGRKKVTLTSRGEWEGLWTQSHW